MLGLSGRRFSELKRGVRSCTEVRSPAVARRLSFQALPSLWNGAQCTCHATIRSQHLMRQDQRLQVAGTVGGSACRDTTGGSLGRARRWPSSRPRWQLDAGCGAIRRRAGHSGFQRLAGSQATRGTSEPAAYTRIGMAKGQVQNACGKPQRGRFLAGLTARTAAMRRQLQVDHTARLWRRC